ncbi:hypothetical protein RHS04_06703 [Rhizoctonia solani]|uniref:Uncharacterized protein n=1 Tax=Rhizoctonia solani TaxID=456999 RepID=A0A8H7H394_9AGAM|nr:hypothetical protein RHS04_06703 [Rhizoctonia solani]
MQRNEGTKTSPEWAEAGENTKNNIVMNEDDLVEPDALPSLSSRHDALEQSGWLAPTESPPPDEAIDNGGHFSPQELNYLAFLGKNILVEHPNLDQEHNPQQAFELEEGEPQVYQFNQLLDDDLLEDSLWNHKGMNKDVIFYNAEDVEDSDRIGEDDGWFNKNLGLPDEEDQPIDKAPVFQLPEDNKPKLPPDETNETNDPRAHYAAFWEPELICNVYIDAFVQKCLFGATHCALRHQLKTACCTLSSHPEIHKDDLVRMAQTIGTVEQCLGVNTNSIITTYVLCPTCKRQYTMEYINEAKVDACMNTGCNGILFTTWKLASGSLQCTPSMTFLFASPIAWIQHILSLSGMAELLQTWRSKGHGDNAGLLDPILSHKWMEGLDENLPIGDISKGWGWREMEAGLEQLYNPTTGNVIDHQTIELPICFVSLPYGILLLLNTDWFQATKEGDYSVGACYLVINNLPQHMRFLRENIALCLIMPGPNKPNNYALDQMLGPLVDDLLQLQQGVHMTVCQGDPPTYCKEVVHAKLTLHIADLIARIKMGRGAGLKSEKNFCLYCLTQLSALLVADGYICEGVYSTLWLDSFLKYICL